MKVKNFSATDTNVAKKVERKGQTLVLFAIFASVAIWMLGFIFFVGSVGIADIGVSTNYVGIAIGLALMGGAFFLGSRKPVKRYMKKYSNEA